MYVPNHFKSQDSELLSRLVKDYSFGTMITPSPDGLRLTHLPCLLDESRGEHGTIRAHVARANDHWKHFDHETTIVFQGPHCYVSPTWYEEVFSVPTWNYAVAHVYGQPVILDDDQSLELLIDLVRFFEGPESTYDYEEGTAYARKSLPGIVAFEIPVSRVEVKVKMSQNKTEGDRGRVVDHLMKGDVLGRDVAAFMVGMDIGR